MEPTNHSLNELFAQLGLPSDSKSIEDFIAAHGPLPDDIPLADASFWTQAQAGFLREELIEDADWAELVDQLDAWLRQR